MNKKYKIIIFDLDDTLINNRENIRYAFEKMIDAQNQKYSDEAFERWYQIDKKFWKDWQDGLIELPDEYKIETGKKSEAFLNWVRSQRVLIYFNNDISLDKAISLNYMYMDALTEIVISIDGAYETLKYLSDKYFILVATNGPAVATRHKIEKIKCLEFVKDILSADMFGYMKPKKEFFEAIQQRYNDYDKEDYLIVGDSLKSDVGFGMNCGIDSCWFDREEEELTNDYKPTIIIKKLVELKERL